MQSRLAAQHAPAGAAEPVRTACVAICAYTMDRWASLVAALDSVLAQLGPDDEVLVVIDHNEALLDRATAAFGGYPRVRVVKNDGPRGLSGARNTAVALTGAGLVAFLDDDAVAGEHWLAGMRTALAAPEVYGVGSAARPRWPGGNRPAWFPPEYDWVVGCSYLGQPTAAADVRNVIGAGMAFRAEAFTLAGDFSHAVGRIGTAPTGCEETELCIRVRQARPQARITYLPEIWVTHEVTQQRLRVRYFVRRCYGEGRSKARVSRLVGAHAGLSSERGYVSSVLPRGLVRELKRGLRGRLAGWSAAALIAAGVLLAGAGYLRERLLGSSPV